MYAVYVLEDTWRLRATFSTRDSADIFAARLVGRGLAPRCSARRRCRGGWHEKPNSCRRVRRAELDPGFRTIG